MSEYFCGFRQLVIIKSPRDSNSWNSKPPWEEIAIFHFIAIINGDKFQAGPLWRSPPLILILALLGYVGSLLKETLKS